jgi:hypothetical protein
MNKDCKTKYLMILLLFALQIFYTSDFLQAEKNTGTAKIVFDSLTFDAGLVKPGDKVQGVFIMKNLGDSDLVIKSVSPT